MAVKELLRWSVFAFVTMMCSVDSIAFNERVRWIALGDEITETNDGTGIVQEVENYNATFPVSSIAEISYDTKNGKRINAVVASASYMNGFVSLEDGGLEEDHVTIKYVTENGARDELYVFVQSYRIEPFVINDNSAKTKSLTVVTNDIKNWTDEILRKFIREDNHTLGARSRDLELDI